MAPNDLLNAIRACKAQRHRSILVRAQAEELSRITNLPASPLEPFQRNRTLHRYSVIPATFR